MSISERAFYAAGSRAAVADYADGGRSFFWAKSDADAVQQARRHCRRKGEIRSLFVMASKAAITTDDDWKAVRPISGDRMLIA